MARSITVIPASQPYRVGGRTQQKTRNLRVAAYCRVSTDQEEQLNSFENQVEYYTKYIQDNPLYQMAGIYADEGISGTNTKKREEFCFSAQYFRKFLQGKRNGYRHYPEVWQLL